MDKCGQKWGEMGNGGKMAKKPQGREDVVLHLPYAQSADKGKNRPGSALVGPRCLVARPIQRQQRVVLPCDGAPTASRDRQRGLGSRGLGCVVYMAVQSAPSLVPTALLTDIVHLSVEAMPLQRLHGLRRG